MAEAPTEPRRRLRSHNPLDIVRVANRTVLAIFLLSLAYLVLHRLFVAPASFYDLRVYRVEGFVARRGGDLYQLLPPPLPTYATYPPFAALCFVPLTLVPLGVVQPLSMVANVCLLLVVARLAAVAVFPDSARKAADATLATSAIGLWAEPVYTTFGYGQINLLLLLLVLGDLMRPDSRRTKGLGIGLAAGLKVTPGIFIVFLLLRRKYRAAAVAFVTLCATNVFSAIFLPSGTWHYWTDYLLDPKRVGRIENAVNQTVRGLSTRVVHSTDAPVLEMLAVAVIAVAGLWLSVRSARRLGELWGACCCAVTGLLISPISWSHHWVWCLPIGIVLFRYSRRWAAYCVVTFCSFVVWSIPHTDGQEFHLSWWQIVLSGAYVYFGIAFLALTAWRVRQRRDAARESPVPSAATSPA